MQNVSLQAKNAKLKAQNDDVATLRPGLADALAALPSDGGLPEFTRQVSAQATATSTVLTSIVVGTAAPVARRPPGPEPTTPMPGQQRRRRHLHPMPPRVCSRWRSP